MRIRGLLFLACFAAVPLLAEVVVPEDAPPVQKRAAAELEKYIEKILGKGKKHPRIVLGNSLAAWNISNFIIGILPKKKSNSASHFTTGLITMPVSLRKCCGFPGHIMTKRWPPRNRRFFSAGCRRPH